jgi:hypothetical protein
VGRLWPWILALEFDDVKGAEHPVFGRGDVAQQDVAEFARGPHPTQPGYRIRLCGHARDAHTTMHPGHGQHEDLSNGHCAPPGRHQADALHV